MGSGAWHMLSTQAEHSFGAHFVRRRNEYYSGSRRTRSNRHPKPMALHDDFKQSGAVAHYLLLDRATVRPLSGRATRSSAFTPPVAKECGS